MCASLQTPYKLNRLYICCRVRWLFIPNLLDLRNIKLFLYHEVKVAVQCLCWYYSVLSVLSVSGGR